jgi:hypothetical protein
VYRLRTSLCLQFKPHHIAAGAIFLAAKFLKVKLPADGEKVWWQEFDVTPRQLEGWSLDTESAVCICTIVSSIIVRIVVYAFWQVAAVVACFSCLGAHENLMANISLSVLKNDTHSDHYYISLMWMYLDTF